MLSGINNSFLSSLTRITPTMRSSSTGITLPVAASASSKVMFGSQTAEIATLYNLSSEKLKSSTAVANDDVIQSLMANALGKESISSLSGLGGMLLSNVVAQRGDYTQALSGTDLDNRVMFESEPAVSLSIETQSGSTLRISLARKSDGIAVSVKTEGRELDDTEAAAVAKLSKAFQSAINGLAHDPKELDIDGLVDFDRSIFKSIDLKTDVRRSGVSQQSLNFHADMSERWVAYKDADFSLKMTSDRSDPSQAGTLAEQEATLNAWDEKFDKALSDGRGDWDQMRMLKSTFRALNKASGDEKVGDKPAPVQLQMTEDDDQSRFKGLNDFSISLTQQERSINPLRLEEKDRFSYSASQSTEETKRGDGTRSLTQTTHSHLSAAWHQTLDPAFPLALDTTKASQNYTYTTVENDERNSTSLNFNDKGLLESIGTHSQVDNLKTVKKYVRGEMVDETSTPEKYEREKVLKILLEIDTDINVQDDPSQAHSLTQKSI